MTSTKVELAALQHWLLAAITEPTAPPQAGIEERLLASREQSAAERLDIYRGAYLARLLEVLREQFPCTRFAVGDELFDQFATSYLEAHPPRSYTLAQLADRLVNHLEATRPANFGEFVVDLVRLEHAIDRVFDTVGPETLPPFTMPQEANDSLLLSLAPGLELHEFRRPVSSYYTAWKAGHKPKWPAPQQQFAAILRRDYVVRRHELTKLQYELLLGISRGFALGEAVAAAACTADDVDADKLAAEFGDWFAAWSASGFFATAS